MADSKTQIRFHHQLAQSMASTKEGMDDIWLSIISSFERSFCICTIILWYKCSSRLILSLNNHWMECFLQKRGNVIRSLFAETAISLSGIIEKVQQYQHHDLWYRFHTFMFFTVFKIYIITFQFHMVYTTIRFLTVPFYSEYTKIRFIKSLVSFRIKNNQIFINSCVSFRTDNNHIF